MQKKVLLLASNITIIWGDIMKTIHKIWNYIVIGLLAILILLLQADVLPLESNKMEYIFGNFVIPFLVLVIVIISITLKSDDEIGSLILLIFGVYVHFHSEIEKIYQISFLLYTTPILLVVLTVQFIIRNKGNLFRFSTLGFIGLSIAYLYLLFGNLVP